MSESVMVVFEGDNYRVDWVTPAKARMMQRQKDAVEVCGECRKPKCKHDVADHEFSFAISVTRSAARRYPQIVRWSASSGGHVMMGAGLMNSAIPVAERARR